MFLPKSIKIFIGLIALFAQSCSFWQSAENQNANVSNAPFAAEQSKSAVPFSTGEPDVYQTEIVLTSYSGGEKTERKIFTARHGAKLRCDYENQVSFLQQNENENFLFHNGKKIYVANQTNFGAANKTGETIKDFLTTEWLNEKTGATFERRGAENGLTQYRVNLQDAPNAASETLIFVDENLKIPVRQEFYAVSGEQRVLMFSMELRGIKLEADDKLFELPKDYRKVTGDEFQKIIRQERLNPKNE